MDTTTGSNNLRPEQGSESDQRGPLQSTVGSFTKRSEVKRRAR